MPGQVWLGRPIGRPLIWGCLWLALHAVSRHAPVLNAGLHMPKVASTAFVAPNASVVGDVTVGDHASVWYNAVVRGGLRAGRRRCPAAGAQCAPGKAGAGQAVTASARERRHEQGCKGCWGTGVL